MLFLNVYYQEHSTGEERIGRKGTEDDIGLGLSCINVMRHRPATRLASSHMSNRRRLWRFKAKPEGTFIVI